MSKAIQVSTYIPPRIYKLLRQESAVRNIPMGEIVSEALLSWFKWLRKEEMVVRKERNELKEIEKLEEMADLYQTELDLLLDARKSKRRRIV